MFTDINAALRIMLLGGELYRLSPLIWHRLQVSDDAVTESFSTIRQNQEDFAVIQPEYRDSPQALTLNDSEVFEPQQAMPCRVPTQVD
jgi:hypothetical protein